MTVPKDLRKQVRKVAERTSRTVDAVVTDALTHYLAEDETVLSLRHRTYQWFHSHGPRKAKPRYTAVVLVDDGQGGR